MKALILKATLIEGISKKVDHNGQPYKISNVSIIQTAAALLLVTV
jgi:hypothetical protein